MPIRPENKHRYPANWRDIRARILARAGQRCEWPGCRLENHAWIYRNSDNPESTMRARPWGRVDPVYGKPVLVVLTIAHLDHTPENCDEANLRAWCQLHHLRYDARQHARAAREARRRRSGQGVLLLE